MMNQGKDWDEVEVTWEAPALPANETPHLLQQFSETVDEAEDRLHQALSALNAIETRHNAILRRVRLRYGEGPETRAWHDVLDTMREGEGEDLEIETLMSARNAAGARFAMLMQAVETANTYFLTDVIAVQLRPLFPRLIHRVPPVEAKAALRDFAGALRDYLWKAADDRNDARVRAAWNLIETLSRPACH